MTPSGPASWRRRLSRAAVAACLTVAPAASVPQHAGHPQSGAEIRMALGTLLDGAGGGPNALPRLEQAAVRAVYGSPPSLLWLNAEGRARADAVEALALLERASDEGLDPRDYDTDRLREMAQRLAAAPSDAMELARFDVTLSAAVLHYYRHLHLGRVDPRTVGFHLVLPVEQHDFASVLRAALERHRIAAAAAELRPPFAQYAALRAALGRYRALAANAALEPPPNSDVTVKPGQPYAGAAALSRWLAALGDVPSGTPPPDASGVYDSALVDAVKRFQIRHGLDVDGVLGQNTLVALRVPLTWRVRQIELALERLRWLPDLQNERLVVVNIPMFRLWAWNSMPPTGPPALGTGVIVGRALSTQTPVFVETMEDVIFRPYWNVPDSILRHEIVPRLLRDPEYLRRENMEIVRGTGDTPVPLNASAIAGLRAGTLRVRQRPGPDNSLGLVKFVFPNEANVYMHGTPARALFARSRRDFSHGCVRVEDPVGLAAWALGDRPEWSRDRIEAAMAGTQTIDVKLARPIQVILFYTTAAVVPEDGSMRFADDIYRHDARLERALSESAAAIRQIP